MKVNPRSCPKCGRSGNWRHGLHFEHEMICWCGGDRSTTWEPGKIISEEYKKDDKEDADGCCN